MGLIVVVLLVLVVAVDAAFCKTKQCGLLWTLSQSLGRKEEGAAAGGKSPEDGSVHVRVLGRWGWGCGGKIQGDGRKFLDRFKSYFGSQISSQSLDEVHTYQL